MKSKPVRSRRREIETPAYFTMLRRMVRAAGTRVGSGDVDELRMLLHVQHELDAAVAAAVTGLRASGATWDMIGAANGTTRQAALMRWSRAGSPSAQV